MRRRRTRDALALAAAVVVAASGCADGPSDDTSADIQPDYEYIVPAGTADRIARGDEITIMPSRLDVEVGDVIRIENQDDEGTTAGPFYVPANTTLVQRFRSEGRYSGECAISENGRYEIVVSE